MHDAMAVRATIAVKCRETQHETPEADSAEPANNSDPLSTAVAIRSQDNTVATLADSAAGTPLHYVLLLS